MHYECRINGYHCGSGCCPEDEAKMKPKLKEVSTTIGDQAV